MAGSAIAVFLGGGFGAVAREFCMLLFGPDGGSFPIDIFAANMLACLLLGLVAGLREVGRTSDQLLLLVGTGFTGGMSTFSSFVYGAYSVGTTPGEAGIAILYVVSSLAGGYGLMWFGRRFAMRRRVA